MPFLRRKTDTKLIVGLGNPGLSYASNRHNIGFRCLNHFARKHGIRFDKRQCQSRIGSGKVAGSQVVVAKPQTFMNRSGQAVSRLVKKYKVTADSTIVIHDDLDLPLGKIRIRPKGGSAGHKGIESTIACLGSPDFTRIRVGIGRPNTGDPAKITEDNTMAFVLSDFTATEKQTISRVIPQVSEAVNCLLTEGLTAAMNRYN